MHKVINLEKAEKIATTLHNEGKTIVLVGGCFDILHKGHITFLVEAKKRGGSLFLLLESDENVKKYKGKNRPINSQENRSFVLSSLSFVDFIIPLKEMTNNEEYDRIILQIKPDVIAQTKGDPKSAQRQKQCELVGARLEIVTNKIEDFSTTKIINNLEINYG